MNLAVPVWLRAMPSDSVFVAAVCAGAIVKACEITTPPDVFNKAHRWVQRGSVTAPAPPLPLARFRVLDQETARRLEAAARDHPRSRLLLGILYAQAGARDQAVAHVAQVPPADPLLETARRTLERVRRRP